MASKLEGWLSLLSRDPSRWLCSCLVFALLYSGCRGCDPYAQIEKDKQRFPAISATRPLGSPCSQSDSASITRGGHPLRPTGGWRTTAEIDYARVLTRPVTPGYSSAGAMFVLMAHEGVIAGYVRVADEGTLRARTYDDIYGTAYGGWSPARLVLRPTDEPVFVALGRSAYGDGGLSRVHEVCWTPRGAAAGMVVYSSAFPLKESPLRTRQVFRSEDLGVLGQYYNDRLALRMLAETLQDRDLPAATKLIGQAEALLGALPAAVDGTTRDPIPSRVFRAREWADLLAFKLGLSVGQPAFAATASDLGALVAAHASNRFGYGCERYERLLPLYRWVDARARGETVAVPDPASLQRGVVGHNPMAIVRLLSSSPERFHAAPMRFWAGVKAYAAGDKVRAATELSALLDGPPPSPSAGFELGAAARLLTVLK